MTKLCFFGPKSLRKPLATPRMQNVLSPRVDNGDIKSLNTKTPVVFQVKLDPVYHKTNY